MHTFLTISPLIIIALAGYLSVRLNLFNKSHIDGLSAVCFNLLIPIFLFNATYSTNLNADISFSWFLSFYIPAVISFLFIYTLFKLFYKHNNKSSSLHALAATYSNTVLVAIPILAKYLPEETAGLAFIIIAFHSATFFSLTEFLSNKSILSSFIKSFSNPIVMSILGGFIVNLSGFTIPDVILTPFVALSSSAISLALFGLGASMFYLPIKGNLKVALSFALFKLFVMPFLAYLVCRYIFQLSDTQTLITVILLASPIGVAAYVMATKNKAVEDVTASTVVISTILCTFSYLFWLKVLI